MLMFTDRDLPGQNVLLAPDKEDITATAGVASVHIARAAVAFVVNNGRDVSVLSLHDGATGDVLVKVGGQEIELRAGEQLVTTGSSVLGFGDVNPIPSLACRDLKEHNLTGGQRAFIAEFSLASALENLNTLKQLAQSPEARSRALHGQILKNAAILHMLTARKGPYKTWRKNMLTARAI